MATNNVATKTTDLSYKPYVSVQCIMVNLLTGLLTILTLLDRTNSFNVDTSTVVVHNGNRFTMYGYSVSQYRDDQGGYWVLIGAPRAQGLSKYIRGDVFKCKVDRPRNCETLGFHQIDDGFNNYSNRTEQWLGATVDSSQKSGSILTCAPRMWIHKTELDKYDLGRLIGGCYVLTSANKLHRFDPCVNPDDKLETVNQKQMCAAGMSAVFNKNGNKIVIGAPGTYAFQGQLIAQKVVDSSILASTRKISSTSVAYGFMGTSTATGKFSSDSYNDYVTGAPRVALTGKVNIYDENLLTLGLEFTGEQMGENFGQSIAVGDFNRDGFDDIAIGAPFYSDYKNSQSYEIGRVYAVYQQVGHEFNKEKTILDGPKEPGCRFGYSLASAKDLNNDGYNDLVIGAPYGGKNGKGAIYIYYGSDSGLGKDYLQVINGHTIDRAMKTFGYSISAGMDQDNNQYPDMVVGAYESDQVAFLRTRAVITPNVKISTINKIDLQSDVKCDLSDGTKAICFDVRTCIRYDGTNVPNDVDFKMTWSLDAHKERSKRVFFMDVANYPSTLTKVTRVNKNRQNCVDNQVILKENMRDKLSPIAIEVTYNVREGSPPRGGVLPIQNIMTPKQTAVDVHILKYCGADEVCIPNLWVRGHSSLDKVTIGKTSNIDLNIYVENVGEDSYESRVFTELPRGVNYINIQTIKSETSITCSAKTNKNGTIVTCDIGNPLPASKVANFRLRAAIMTIPHDEESLNFHIHANSTNPENVTDTNDNHVFIDVQLAAEAVIDIRGKSIPEQILYNTTQVNKEVKSVTDLGPALTHIYEVRNLGPSNVSSVMVKIFWPSFVEDKDLLYMVDTPQVLKKDKSCCHGQCTAASVNLKNLKIPSTNLDNEEDSINVDIISRRKRNAPEQYNEQAYEVCFDTSDLCTLITCHTDPLGSDDWALIKINSRVVISTLVKQYSKYDSILVASFAKANITDFPYETTHVTRNEDTFQIETFMSATDQSPVKRTPIWIIIVSVVVGIVLLVVLVVILYYCGFFKRKQHEDMKRLTYTGGYNNEETNPMNTSDDEL